MGQTGINSEQMWVRKSGWEQVGGDGDDMLDATER